MKVLWFGLAAFCVIGLTGCDRPSPEQLRQKQHLPGPDFIADVRRGEQLFHAICSRCHGKDGRGTEQGPPLIDKIYRPSHHADLVFHWAIRDGVKQHHWKFGNMPASPNVGPEQAGHMIAFVRDEQRKAGIR